MTGRMTIMAKVSGEQLAGSQASGISEATTVVAAQHIAEFFEKTGTVPVLLPGGGNFLRGRDSNATTAAERADADYEGMIGTVRNAEALTDALNELGRRAICLVNMMPDLVHPDHKKHMPYDYRIARERAMSGVIPVIGGGNGRPYSSTDLASVVVGGELGCSRVMKGTDVDGVYDVDPKTNPDATLYDRLSFTQAIERGLDVMEPTAWMVAQVTQIPITVYNMNEPNGLLRAYNGEIGTQVEVG